MFEDTSSPETTFTRHA